MFVRNMEFIYLNFMGLVMFNIMFSIDCMEYFSFVWGVCCYFCYYSNFFWGQDVWDFYIYVLLFFQFLWLFLFEVLFISSSMENFIILSVVFLLVLLELEFGIFIIIFFVYCILGGLFFVQFQVEC